MLCGCLLLTSVPIARIGRRIEEGCLFYKSWVQRWIGGISVTAKIRNDVPSSEKEKEEKPEKRRKRKRTAFSAWRRRSVKVLSEKIMPGGLHFRGANGEAA